MPAPVPSVTPGAYVFQSLLEKPDPKNPGYYVTIPAGDVPYQLRPTRNPHLPPASQVFQYNGGWFEPLID